MADGKILSSIESKSLYGRLYQDLDTDITERTRTSWLMDLRFTKDMMENVPSAIQIELSFCDLSVGVCISPFTLAYYLMFLCYDELRQYEDRDRALRLLVDVVNNPEQRGYFCYYSFNIAGHCLLLAVQIDNAHDMFIRSYKFTQRCVSEKYNSALQYLQKIPRWQ